MLTSNDMILPDLIVHKQLYIMTLSRYGGMEKGPIKPHTKRASRKVLSTIRWHDK